MARIGSPVGGSPLSAKLVSVSADDGGLGPHAISLPRSSRPPPPFRRVTVGSLSAESPHRDTGHMSKKIRKFRTDKFDEK